MKIVVERLEDNTRRAGIMAQFDKLMSPSYKDYLINDSLDYVRVAGCMKWIWFQWLSHGLEPMVRERVAAFVESGIEVQRFSPQFKHRPRHDVLLLNCAIFASPKEQLVRLAEQVVDASGFKGNVPKDDGDLYASAWCGVFKYWILGDFEKSAQQAEIVWGSYSPPWLKAATKPLAVPWLKRDWNGFAKAQKKDFEKLWNSARKNSTVRSETPTETVVRVESYPAERAWCWAHCGMALLAHREGKEVVTDPFWFPAHALKCVPIGQA